MKMVSAQVFLGVSCMKLYVALARSGVSYMKELSAHFLRGVSYMKMQFFFQKHCQIHCAEAFSADFGREG